MIVFQQQGKKVGGSSGYKIKMIIQFESKYNINLWICIVEIWKQKT